MNGPLQPHRNDNCVIEVKPRLHVTLVGMDAIGYRTNGGVGFSINEPTAYVQGKLASTTNITDHRLNKFSEDGLYRIQRKIAELQLDNSNIELDIVGKLPTHCGLGSSTAIRLACLEVCNRLWKSPYSQEALVLGSGRGGTSGIGIRTYFSGGMVFDAGVSNKGIHEPSSQSESRTVLPLVLVQSEMPSWKIGICLPQAISALSEEQEQQFFHETCPISSTFVKDILYAVTFGLVPAILEQDYRAFCVGIKEIQKTKWKSSERDLYGPPLTDIEDLIYQEGADCVGMSSLGPCLFFLASNLSDVVERLRIKCSTCDWIITSFNNAPRIVHA